MKKYVVELTSEEQSGLAPENWSMRYERFSEHIVVVLPN